MPFKIKKWEIILLIFSIFFIDISFFGQSAEAYSLQMPSCENTYCQEKESEKKAIEKPVLIRMDKMLGSSRTAECIRRSSKPKEFHYLGKYADIFLKSRFYIQFFNPKVYAGKDRISDNDSGHLKLVRLIYRKDGKKRLTIQ